MAAQLGNPLPRKGRLVNRFYLKKLRSSLGQAGASMGQAWGKRRASAGQAWFGLCQNCRNSKNLRGKRRNRFSYYNIRRAESVTGGHILGFRFCLWDLGFWERKNTRTPSVAHSGGPRLMRRVQNTPSRRRSPLDFWRFPN